MKKFLSTAALIVLTLTVVFISAGRLIEKCFKHLEMRDYRHHVNYLVEHPGLQAF